MAVTDNDSFYERFPFQQPADFLAFLDYRVPKEGDATAVLAALDEFSSKYPMYKLSKIKADILLKEIAAKKPKRVLEIGTFFGYSALNTARNLPEGSTLTCIEANEANAEVARAVLSRGLGSSKATKIVNIIEGISTRVVQTEKLLVDAAVGKLPFDFVFLDHDKDSYLKDLKLLEENGLITEDCVVIADNVVFPGAPGYLEYVGDGRYSQNGDSVSVSVGGYRTRLASAPFERIGFETKWKEVDDAMSISQRVISDFR